jgi:hypothetical protein
MVDLRLRKKSLVNAVDPVGTGFVDSRYLSSGRSHACCGVVRHGCCDVSADVGPPWAGANERIRNTAIEAAKSLHQASTQSFRLSVVLVSQSFPDTWRRRDYERKGRA